MNKAMAAGLLALASGASWEAQAQTCPPGEIFRVKLERCEAKSESNVKYLKEAAPRPPARIEQRPAVVAKAKPKPKPRAQPSRETLRPVTTPPKFASGMFAAKPKNVPADDPKLTDDVRRFLTERAARTAGGQAALPRPAESPDPAVAPPPAVPAAEPEAKPAPHAAAPAPATNPPDPVKLAQTPWDAAEPGSFWANEHQAAETLAKLAKGPPLDEYYSRGESVRDEIKLQPLPSELPTHPLARLNVQYFMANGNAVLVLPASRVVVQVYHAEDKDDRIGRALRAESSTE